MKNKSVYCLTLACLFLLACRKDKISTVNSTNQIVSFSSKIKPMIDNNCISCHDVGMTAPNLATYSSISLNANSILNSLRGEGGVTLMPKGGPKLSETIINNFSVWVSQGKQNN